MKTLTKISIVLFLLLLALTAGSVTLIRDLVRDLDRLTWAWVQDGRKADADAFEEQSARIRLAAITEQIEARCRWLGARLQWLARDEALAGGMARSPARPLYAPGLAVRLETLRAQLPLLWLVSASGTPVQVVKANGPRRGGGAEHRDTGRPPTGLPESFETLLARVLEGRMIADVRSVETALERPVQAPGAAFDPGAGRNGGAESALLVLGLPVRSGTGDVVGAVLGGVGLELGSWFPAGGSARNALAVEGLAIRVGGQRRLILGNGLATSASGPVADGESVRGGGHASAGKAVVQVAGPMDLPGAPGNTLLELSVERHDLDDWDRDRLAAAWAGAVRKASALLGLMALLALALAIEGARRALRPIHRLLVRAERVSTGKLDVSFKDLSGGNEVGRLARSFERMRISIRKLMADRADGVPGDGGEGRTKGLGDGSTGADNPSR